MTFPALTPDRTGNCFLFDLKSGDLFVFKEYPKVAPGSRAADPEKVYRFSHWVHDSTHCAIFEYEPGPGSSMSSYFPVHWSRVHLIQPK